MALKDRHIQAGHLYPVIPVSLDDYPFDAHITNNVATTVTNTVSTVPADGLNLDAFGRQRVSSATNRFDVEFIYNKQPDIVDEVISGAATATHNTNSRDVTLDIVDANNGTSAALYGYDVPYTPGNSQLIDITGTLDNVGIGGGTAFLFLRTTVTGVTTEATYQQTAWNINTATSIDWTTSQIFVIDFQSLKVGRIRFAFVRNGVAVPVHQIFNDNIRATGYWQLPSLPVYWRIYNDVTYTYMEMGYGDTLNAVGLRYRIDVNANATMRAICASVKSEDGVTIENIPGFERAVSNMNTAKTVSTTLIPVLSIRPAATYAGIANRGIYIPDGFSIQGDNPIRFRIVYRSTLTNPAWTAVDATNSGMEYDVSATAITGGIVINEDYASAGVNSVHQSDAVLGRTLLKLGRTGTSDILSIAAIRTGTNNSSTYGVFRWREIR